MNQGTHNALSQIPVKQDFVLEIINKKPGWFIRYGGFIIVIGVLISLCMIYMVSRKNLSYTTQGILQPKSKPAYLYLPSDGLVTEIIATNKSFIRMSEPVLSFKPNNSKFLNDNRYSRRQDPDQAYLYTSKKTGNIHFLQNLQPGIQISDSVPFALIASDDKTYTGFSDIPVSIASKIHVGQTLLVNTGNEIDKKRTLKSSIKFISDEILTNKRRIEFELVDNNSALQENVFKQLPVTVTIDIKN